MYSSFRNYKNRLLLDILGDPFLPQYFQSPLNYVFLLKYLVRIKTTINQYMKFLWTFSKSIAEKGWSSHTFRYVCWLRRLLPLRLNNLFPGVSDSHMGVWTLCTRPERIPPQHGVTSNSSFMWREFQPQSRLRINSHLRFGNLSATTPTVARVWQP